MYTHQSFVILIPFLLSHLFTTVSCAPTQIETEDLMPDFQLKKRDVNGWIESFTDVGCHNPVQDVKYTPLDNNEHCVNWNSSQPGLYFGINWGQVIAGSNFNQIELFTEPGCQGTSGAPLYAGSKGEPAGNYLQKAPPGVYKGKAPMGQCFDGVFRHWPVASDGSAFQSFTASSGPQHASPY